MTRLKLILLFSVVSVSVLTAQENEQYTVAAPTASLRSGDGKQEPVLATLSKNEVVQVLKTNTNGWWYVEHNGTRGFVIAQFLKKRSNEGWISRKYESGDTPDCENITAEYDKNLDNHLKVTVNSNSDVVVKLMKKQAEGDLCIRTTYIESNDFAVIRNIPEGKYYLKIAYGNDWRQRKTGGKCTGRFAENARYEIGKQQLNYKIVQLSNRMDIPSYSLTLGNKVQEGVDATFTSENISEAEFNN